MFVKVSAAGIVSLEDSGNFRAFKVVIEGGPAALDGARRALAGTADVQDQATAWVFAAALRGRAEVARNADWQKDFDAMIEKAKPHGWIDEKRNAIKAHIEWME
ncbi:MAG: hypothetical protein FJX62_24155 [Alphaproteobacteria bacterium]|nr:hypothetical protein [Alphaproteobacteria bacterium]